MADTAIILNNAGNDVYAQTAREYLTSPIVADFMRIVLTTATQLNNIIRIRNTKSVGTGSNRDISIGSFVKAGESTNLIIEIPLNPPIILDGQTYFQTVLEPNSEMDILFYFDEQEIGKWLQELNK
jgi:hypothetical protein